MSEAIGLAGNRVAQMAGWLGSKVGFFGGEAESLPNLSAAEREFYSKAELIGNYDYLHSGQLPNDMSVTFIGSRYNSYRLLDDVVLQRAGTRLKPFGQSFSFDKPVSELQTRIDKAILPKWPAGGASPIDTGFAIRIPKGSIVHVGDVANQGEIFMGGTRQVVVQAPWSIPGVEVVDTYPLQEEALWNEIANQFKR